MGDGIGGLNEEVDVICICINEVGITMLGFPGVYVGVIVDFKEEDFNADDEQVACYGVALSAASAYRNLGGDVAIWHCDTTEVVEEGGYPMDYGVTETKEF